MKLRLTPLLLVMLLLACSQSPTPLPETNPALPTAQLQSIIQPTSSPTPPEPSPTPQPAPLTEYPDYHMDVRLDYNNHLIEVSQTVNYPNHSGEDIKELALVVEPLRVPESFKLNSLLLDQQPVEDYTLNDAKLTIPLAQPLADGKALALSLSYAVRLPSRYGALGYTWLQANFHNWFPFFPPYQPGEGWLIHPYSEQGEYLVYPTADFEVILTSQDPAIRLAAPGTEETNGDTHTYRLEKARTFMWSASPYLQVTNQQVGEIEVKVYYFAEHQAAAEHLLQEIGKALMIDQELFGSYPFTSLSAVEFNSHDGMEADGIYFLSYTYFNGYDPENPEYEAKFKNYLTTIGVHEVCHNWWYSQVGNDQALEPWLDEALSTYCELLYYQRTNPELTTWWWDQRVDYWWPEGWVNASVYQVYDYQSYVNAVYLRGATFLSNLRAAIGDKAFFEALREYAEQGRYKIMHGEDLLQIMRQHSKQDLTPTIEEFFRLESTETPEPTPSSQ
jgi:hypothetical protein